jgi:hypothetical protein
VLYDLDQKEEDMKTSSTIFKIAFPPDADTIEFSKISIAGQNIDLYHPIMLRRSDGILIECDSSGFLCFNLQRDDA